MAGILLIALSYMVGYYIIKDFIRIKSPASILAGSFIIGCLFSGSILYLLDLLFIYTMRNYLLGSFLFITASAFYIIYSIGWKRNTNRLKNILLEFSGERWAILSTFIFAVFSFWLSYHTFHIQNGNIKVIGAWSDIMYHHSYVRSISIGNNVPVEFPYYANAPICYHFMFDYYAGKLAQLGLNSVHSLNIMSSLSLTALLMLVSEFGRRYFGSVAAGILGPVFLILHSSLSAFKWISDNLGKDIFQKAINKTGWLQGATFEDWGLFNLNVFINQRHFAFTIAIVVFLVLYILENMAECKGQSNETNLNRQDFMKNVFIGVIIGILPFWNAIAAGVCMIFTVLFAVAGIRNRKFFFGMLYSAVIAAMIAVPQLLMFKSGDSALSGYPVFHTGYAVGRFSITALVEYYFKVLGLKLPLIALSLLFIPLSKKLDFMILAVPFIMANMYQFGTTLYDNNKLIIIWLVFANCFAAYLVARIYNLFKRVHVTLSAAVALLLILTLTVAGILDFFSVKNMGTVEIADKDSDFKQWIVSNTEPDSVFLANYSIPYGDNAVTSITLSGRKLYVNDGARSSYNIHPRIQIAKRIYSFDMEFEEIVSIIKREGIDYIVIDELVKNNKDLRVNEEKFSKHLHLKYKNGNISVYSLRNNAG